MYVRAQVSHERSKRLLDEREREQVRVEHDRALRRLESELSVLRISAKHDQTERERTTVDKVPDLLPSHRFIPAPCICTALHSHICTFLFLASFLPPICGMMLTKVKTR